MNSVSENSKPSNPNPAGRGMADWIFAPVDNASLVYFRIAYGSALIAFVYFAFAHDWIDEVYLATPVHFPFYGFDWLPRLPEQALYVHFYALGVLGALIVLGLGYRVVSVLACLAYAYVFFLDKVLFQNHLYFLLLLSILMIFIPAHRSFSLDSLLRPSIRTDAAPAWTLWLIRAQIGIVYFYGGIAKMNPEWLSGRSMQAQLLSGEVRTQTLFESLYDERWFALGFTYGGLLFDLLIVPALIWRRTRVLAFIAALVFNVSNVNMFFIDFFPYFMLGATLMFFEPDWPRKFIAWARLRPPVLPEPTPPSVAQSKLPRTLTLTLLGLYLTFQALFPFRHFAYPGFVHWTGEGRLFSWDMRMNSFEASANFLLTDPSTGKSELVDPLDYITVYQFGGVRWPSSYLQLAHYIGDDFRQRGIKEVEIRPLVFQSINRGPKYFWFDPNVDLMKEKATIRHADWVLDRDDAWRADAIGPQFTSQLDEILRGKRVRTSRSPFFQFDVTPD